MFEPLDSAVKTKCPEAQLLCVTLAKVTEQPVTERFKPFIVSTLPFNSATAPAGPPASIRHMNGRNRQRHADMGITISRRGGSIARDGNGVTPKS